MIDNIKAAIRNQCRELDSKIRTIARVATMSNADADGDRMTGTATTTDGESHDEVQVMEPYGYTSNPPSGGQGILLCQGGDAGHPVMLLVGSQRLTGLASGEVAVHVGGEATARVILRANGDIELTHGTGGVVSISGPLGGDQYEVARNRDSIALSADNITTVATIAEAWSALAEGGGGPLVVPPGSALPTFDGTGTITSGGTGAVST